MWRSTSSSQSKQTKAKKVISEESVHALFAKYAEEDDPEIISSGIGTIAEELNIDPTTDVRILVLMWKLGAKSKPGCITKEEFTKGMIGVQKDSVAGLVELLPTLDPGFLDKSEFRDFYKFVFQFSREGTHKTLEKEVVLSLLPIVLDAQRTPHLPKFMEFLNHTTHQRITLDQWDSFIPFNESVDVNLVGYNDEDAWPVLLDEFVDWLKK